MALQASAALPLPGLASTVDMLPSLSSTLSAPWRILGRKPPFADTSTQRRDYSTRRTAEEASGHQLEQSQAHNVARDHFSNLSPLKLNPSYSTATLAADYTVSALFSGVGRNLRRTNTFTSQSLPRLQTTRLFSTSTSFGPVKLFAPARPSTLKSIQLRRLQTSHNNSQVSHNLLAHLELTANNNPSSASSQNAFYSALLRANMPEILVERYETGRYATNASCDTLYTRAVDKLGQGQGAGAVSGNLSPEQINAIGRAAGASSRGASTASARMKNGSSGSGAKDSPLYVVVGESAAAFVFKIFKFALTYGLIAYFAMIFVTFAIEASGVLRRVGGAQSAEVKPEQQKTRFSDVQGCNEAIEELQEIVDFLKSPDKYNQLGGKLPKGVLMIGPPGTGKTLLARAVAGEAGVPFFYMSGSEFDEVYVGVGAKRVRDLFAAAKAKAPAIVFIDEIDAIGGKRNERDASYHMQTLNQMLTELDGFDQGSGVVFIGATNFPQLLDKALTRPGRFDRQVVVSLPDVRGRIDILKYHMRNMQINTDVDVSYVARGTPGFSGADLENLVNQAAVHASKNRLQKVDMNSLDWAKDRIIMGAERKSAVIQHKDKVMTAYHEAGHAVVALFTKGAMPLYKCTIMPRGSALGVTHSMPEMDKVSQTKQEYMAQIDVFMGGKIAEELIYGEDQVSSGCSSDLTGATNIAYGMVTQYGMSDQLGSIAFDNDIFRMLSTETKLKVESEVRRILDDGNARAKKLLISKRKELELLAQALIKYETLSRDEIEKVVRGEPLPDKLATLPSTPLKIPELPPTLGTATSRGTSPAGVHGNGTGNGSGSSNSSSSNSSSGDSGNSDSDSSSSGTSATPEFPRPTTVTGN